MLSRYLWIYVWIILNFQFSTVKLSCQPDIWKSLSGNFYRPGYWWTVRFQTPASFPGSFNRMKAGLDHWYFKIQGQEIKSDEFTGYFFLTGSYPFLSLILQNSDGYEKVLIQETLKLKPLKPEDILIGIYGKKEWEKVLEHLLAKQFPSLYFQSIEFIPDCWQGLEIFQMIIVGHSTLSNQEINELCRWVHAGGKLWIWDDSFFRQSAFQEFFLTAFRKKWGAVPQPGKITNMIYFQAGLGEGIYTPLPDNTSPEEEILSQLIQSGAWLLTKNSSRKKMNVLPLEDIFTSFPEKTIHFSHDFHIQDSFRVICFCHIFLFLLLVWLLRHFGYGYRAIATVSIIMSAAFTGCLYWEIGMVFPMGCRRFQMIQLSPLDGITLEESFYYLKSFRKTPLPLLFSSLPMPVNGSQSPEMTAELSRKGQNWQILPFSRNPSLWYTKKLGSVPGPLEIKIEESAIVITNHSTLDIRDCLYLEQKGYRIWGKEATNSLQIQFESPIMHIWNHSELFPFWRETCFFHHFRGNLPLPVFLARVHGKYSPELPVGALDRGFRIVWFPINPL